MNRAWNALAGLLPALTALFAVNCGVAAKIVVAAPQEKEQAELTQLRDEKVAAAVFKLTNWSFEYEAALARAAKEDKLVFAYFTRSYASCRPCTRLEEGALSERGFAEFGKQVVLFCHVTSHVDGDANPGLLHDKGGRAFPYLVFMTSAGDVLAKLGPRDRTVAAFEETRAACIRYLALEKRLGCGDESVAPDLLIARIEMGGTTLTEARRAAARLEDVPAAKRTRLAELMLDLEVNETMSAIRTRTQAAEAGRRFVAMLKQDRVPRNGRAAANFWALVMEAAYADKDAKMYERALGAYAKVAPQGRRRQAVLDRLARRLEELKGKQ